MILKFRAADLLWRPVGILVRFVVVLHPQRGNILLMFTDLTLPPLDIIRIYGLRFKIEVSFKQALHVIGAYAYHFWMAAMTPLRRVSGNQYLHHKSVDTATLSAARSPPTIATSNSDSSPRDCFRSSPRPNPSWYGDLSAPGYAPFVRDWPPPNRSSPSPSAIPFRNFSQVPPNPQSS